MSSWYVDTVTSEEKYTKYVKDAQSLWELPVASGSKWGVEQLKACHFIVNPYADVCLPLSDNYDQTVREKFKRVKETAHIAAFIEDMTPNYRTMRQHALVQQPGVGATLARYWVALMDVKKLESDMKEPHTNQRTSGRVRSQTAHPGYIDSGGIVSSSPVHEASPPSSSDTTTDSFTSVKSPAAYLPIEAYTVELAFSAITHILFYTQDPSLDTPVEIRQPETHFMQVKDRRITAIDDGGFTVISRAGARTKKSVVLIEAKRRLDVCKETNRPFVSDERLGQMTCEAVARKHYMCFFHFIVTPDHPKDVDEGRIPSKDINVTATRWFNLERRPDRKCIVKNVLQLVEYMRQTEG